MHLIYKLKKIFGCVSELELAAYHESGHTVFAEMSGYKTIGMKLDTENQGDGVSGFLFQGDRRIVNELIRFDNSKSLNIILSNDFNYTCQVAFKIFNIYAAGTCAEYVFKYNRKLPKKYDLAISGDDLKPFNHIENFIKTHMVNSTLKPNLCELIRQINTDDVWVHIDTLAQNILRRESHTLTSEEITVILQGTNFY